MFIIDVLRHGGGAHFDGLIARLNNDGCIGWRDVTGRYFSADELRSQVQRMILNGDLTLESMWDGRGILSTEEALNTEWSDEVLISETDKALTDWANWEPPATR